MKRKPQLLDLRLPDLVRDEVSKWSFQVQPLIFAALFCFCHRLTTGKTFEETFNTKQKPEDWTGYSI